MKEIHELIAKINACGIKKLQLEASRKYDSAGKGTLVIATKNPGHELHRSGAATKSAKDVLETVLRVAEILGEEEE